MSQPTGPDCFGQADRDLIRLMILYGMIKYTEEPFKLKSGIFSNVYVFGRQDLTDHPDLLWALGSKLKGLYIDKGTSLGIRDEHRQTCVIGIPTAGYPLAQAMSMVSFKEQWRPRQVIGFRQMRQVKKSHGANQTWIDGIPDHEHYLYCAIENVVTSGESVSEAGVKFEEDGYRPKKMPHIVLIDRQQGGIDNLTAAGYENIIPVYKLLDIAQLAGEERWWPAGVADSVEQEIREHQVKRELR